MQPRSVVGLAVLAGLFVADRVTKRLALRIGEREWNSFVALRPTENSGIAFSLPLPAGLTTMVVAGLVVVLGAIAIRKLARSGRWFPWGLLAVGGAANLFDRLRFGHVIDFVSLGPFPIFNLADLFVLAGIVQLAFPRLTEPAATR